MRRHAALALLASTVACASSSRNVAVATHDAATIQTVNDRTRIESDRTVTSTSYTVPLTRDDALATLVRAYTEHGVTGSALLDTADGTRTFGVRHGTFRASLGKQRLSRFIDCGTGAMGRTPADAYAISLTATTTVIPTGDHTTIRTVVMATARDPGTSNDPVECTSTGRFEREIARSLKASDLDSE